MDTGGLIAATVTVAEAVAAAPVEMVASTDAEQDDDYKNNPNAAIVAITEKHVKFPPLIGFTPFYEKAKDSVTYLSDTGKLSGYSQHTINLSLYNDNLIFGMDARDCWQHSRLSRAKTVNIKNIAYAYNGNSGNWEE